MKTTDNNDQQALKDLLTLTVGAANVLFADDDGNLLEPYLEESRGRQMGKAFAVVFPSTTEEVASLIGSCRFYKVPIVTQGGNTGRCLGAQSDDERAIIINLKHLNRIREIDTDNMTITAEAGCLLADVQQAVVDAGYFFPLSMGAEGTCQIGGNLATNAGGINVLRYGNARDLTLGIEAVLADGNVLNELYGLRKNNTGYDLKNLLIGSEGTLGIITAATFKLFPPETHDEHGFIAVSHVEDAITCLHRVQAAFTGKVSSFELLPHLAIEWLEKYSDLRCPIGNQHPWYVWYRIADANPQSTLAEDNMALLAELMEQGIVIDATVSQNARMKALFAQIRETIVEVQKPEGAVMKFDIAVPISAVPTLIQRGEAAIKSLRPDSRLYAFGHLGDGNLHFNVVRPPTLSDAEFLATYSEPLSTLIYDIVDGLSGTFSAEHGIGSYKLQAMTTYKDPVALDLMRRIKYAFDPFGLLNPGKVVPPKC